ncbi:MAG TPA: HDOD domain-containing protein, partial [Rudaea sp.]
MSARVLFVDDETRVLDGLRRTLFAQRVDWKCDFANDGIAALQLIDRTPYDAVVADMNMAPMDGTELLCQVRDRRPATLRFVLSGHIGTEMAVRALSVAQQLLSKPCDTRALVDAIESGVAVQRRLSDPLIRTMIGRLKALPAAPRVYSQITAALLHPLCDARRIASILARDPGLAANVLHLANSAFFNTGGRSAADLGQAVARVGLATIADLVLATEVFDASANGAAADRLRNRSLFASRLAARIAAGRSDAGLAATAALLCDIG